MKTIITILILTISLSLSAQNLAADIEKQYSLLDKDEYFRMLVENYRIQQQNYYYNYRKQDEKRCKESGGRWSPIDTSGKVAKSVEEFERLLKKPNPNFILRLKYCQNGFIVDTSQLKYEIFWEEGKTIQYILFDYGVIETQHCFIATVNKTIGKREKRTRPKILKMKPRHLLSCDAVSGMLYCLDNTIMVYSIGDDKFYQLDEYLKLFLEKILLINKRASEHSDYCDRYLKRMEE